jgi:hypothetical protein
MDYSAVLSDDERFRYRLSRTWLPSRPALAIVMLNPSTADAKVNDPTIRKCLWFAGAWHYGGIDVVNMCALRATDPSELFMRLEMKQDVIGPDNLHHIRQACKDRDVLVAWGQGVKRLPKNHVEFVELTIANSATKVYCLGKTKTGYPSHPLYIAKNTQPEPFTWPVTTI